MQRMNKFDEFVEAADKELEVDTSTRNTAIYVSSPSSSNASAESPKGDPASRKELKMRQFNPKRLSYQDHPLKEGQVPLRKPSRSTTINKRKSLLQPIVAPQTPENSVCNWNAVGNSPNTSFGRQRSTSGASVHSRSSSQSLSLDSTFDISLQNLANKELEILESKRRIEELRKKLSLEELAYEKKVEELKELKSQVSNNLQVNTLSPPARKQEEPLKEANVSNGTSGSVWSKPLAFFNQFDQIIQHELERSLHWDETPEDKIMRPEPYEGATGVQHKQLRQQSVQGHQSSFDSSDDDKTNNNNKNLWSFLSDVKTGLMGIEEEEEAPSRTIAGSSQKTGGIKEFKTAKKTKDPVEMTEF